MRTGLFDSSTGHGEVVQSAVRKLDVDPQAIELKIDASRIQFEVDAILVSSNSNALRRLHFFYEVHFTDGTDGDNGLIVNGLPVWPDEIVVFTDSGLEVVVPFHWGDDESVTFAEAAFKAAWAIQNTEFVTFADYSVQYVLDFLSIERVTFSDLSVAWQGVARWDESVTAFDSLAMFGGNTVALSEQVSISEVMLGGPDVAFGDAVRWSELLMFVLDFSIQPDFVTFTDALVVSEVAATDARPGAFIPGSALLGSPQ